jgi:hypothetical protein
MIDKRPVIIYCTSGSNSAIYTIWSIRSLLRFDYEPIEVIVGSEEEKLFIQKHLPGQMCHVADVQLDSFRGFSFKAFALSGYTPFHEDRDIVVCDADVLFTIDPKPLFLQHAGSFWFHKIYPLNVADYELSLKDVSAARWSLLTLLHYREKTGFDKRPPWILNSGLFMMKPEWFGDLMRLWEKGIRELGPELMLNDQSMLTVAAAKMGLEPVFDRDEGYATARHYLSTLKPQLVEAAISAGLDPDDLASMVSLPHQMGPAGRLGDFVKRAYRKMGRVVFRLFQD